MSIENYKFSDDDVCGAIVLDCFLHITLKINVTGNIFELNKADVIELAKHFKLTAHDVDCSEHKALVIDSDATDEAHYNECQDLRVEIAELNKKLLSKKVN